MNRFRIVLALLALLTLGAPAAALDRDALLARHRQLDASINGGDGYSKHADSSTLAWAESYILSSYLAAFDASGDTSYLDQIVRHGDQILAGATDPDGDGLLGWQTARYSNTRTQNPTFDEKGWWFLSPARLRGLPKHWERWQSTRATAYRAEAGGDAYAVVKTDPARGWQVLQSKLLPYSAGGRYQLQLRGRIAGSGVAGRIDILDRTAGKVLAQRLVTQTAWTAHAVDFTAPSAPGHELIVRLFHARHDLAGGEAHFDDVQVKRFVHWQVHEGMVAFPLAQFARLVRSQPALQVAYGAAATRFVTFLEAHVVPKWEPYFRRIGAGRGTYIFPGEAAYPWPGNSMPHNQTLALGRAFAHLYAATGRDWYRVRTTEMARAWLAHVRLANGRYDWNYADPMLPTDYQPANGSEDTSHANIEVGFALDAQALGLGVTRTDVDRIATTFELAMWNQSFTSPMVARHVNGDGDGSYQAYLGEWCRLSRAGDRGFAIAEAIYDRHGYWAAPPHKPTAMLVAARLAATAIFAGGDMERGALSDATLPAGWQRWQSTSGTARRHAMGAHRGSYGAVLLTNPSRGWQVLEQPLRGYVPGEALDLRFAARLDGSGAGGRVVVYDFTARRTLATVRVTSAGWRGYGARFTAPAAPGHDVRVRLLHEDWRVSNGLLRVDDVVVRPAPPRAAPTPLPPVRRTR